MRSISSINCFWSTFSLPTICLMNTCWSRSSTFGLSSKSLIRHLQNGKERAEEAEGNFLDLYSNYIRLCTHTVNIYSLQRHDKQGSILTHLQMKSLKFSDQSSGWWRVGGGFLFKGGIEKINGKIRWDLIYTGRPENRGGRSSEQSDGETFFTINQWRHPELVLRWAGTVTNVTQPAFGSDKAAVVMERTGTGNPC